MRRHTRTLLAFFTASAVLLVGGSAFGLGVTPEGADIGLNINGFITVAPGFFIQDAPDSDLSGDPESSLELSLESRIHFTIGTDTFKITGAKWTRKDPLICDPPDDEC